MVEPEPEAEEPEVEGLDGLEVDGLEGCADGSDFCAGWLGLGWVDCWASAGVTASAATVARSAIRFDMVVSR
jgi:hypothetical protein